MQFEWDSRKADHNLVKHGVAFEVAELVWRDPAYFVVSDRHESGEERWHAIGLVRGVLILTVIHTYRDRKGEERVRIIGARRATRAERDRYEAQDD
jgi:uncharacterized protein